MEFSSTIYRGDPCPEFSFSFKSVLYLTVCQKLKHLSKDEFLILRELCRTAKNLTNQASTRYGNITLNIASISHMRKTTPS